MKLKLLALLSGLLLACLGTPALADNCAPYPYTLTNGSTADANQVMADFNNILDCGNTALLGVNNNLSDVADAATSRANIAAAGVTITAWTPTLTFATPGDLTVVTSTDTGSVYQFGTAAGSMCYATFNVVTTTFTFTTAAGVFEITGLPVTPNANFQSQALGALGTTWSGFTGLTSRPAVVMSASSIIELNSGTNSSAVLSVSNFTSGSNVTLRGSILYRC